MEKRSRHILLSRTLRHSVHLCLPRRKPSPNHRVSFSAGNSNILSRTLSRRGRRPALAFSLTSRSATDCNGLCKQAGDRKRPLAPVKPGKEQAGVGEETRPQTVSEQPISNRMVRPFHLVSRIERYSTQQVGRLSRLTFRMPYSPVSSFPWKASPRITRPGPLRPAGERDSARASRPARTNAGRHPLVTRVGFPTCRSGLPRPRMSRWTTIQQQIKRRPSRLRHQLSLTSPWVSTGSPRD